MDVQLMELTVRELLEKFGAGNHKPGSGSAAAQLGLTSAQLIRTVISLTDKPKRGKIYDHAIPELKRILSEVDNRIIPRLQELFQTDSDQFHKAIILREKRDKETNAVQKALLAQQATKELIPSTEIPIEIAALCSELADFATYIFANGFKSARGDAGVAQQAAISAIGGCLSIVHLNLLSFGCDTWTDYIRAEAKKLEDKYHQLTKDGIDYLTYLRIESDKHNAFQSDLNTILSRIPDETVLTETNIEDIAIAIQRLLWQHKEAVWKYKEIDDPLDVLKPDITLKKMGYEYYTPDSIERHKIDNEVFDVAGLIDKKQKFVQVSKAYSVETQSFTAAHELGHALLHQQNILHRDRPIDGSNSTMHYDETEKQANKFAAFFLMPAKQVIKAFVELYEINKFVLTEDCVFILTSENLATFRQHFKTKRDVSRFLSHALAGMFNVSIETMAIRLEELGLVDY